MISSKNYEKFTKNHHFSKKSRFESHYFCEENALNNHILP